MNKRIMLALAGAISMEAWAQALPPADAVVIRAPQLIELPAQRNRLWYNEFERISGSYALSDGRRMSLSLEGDRMYADIDGIGKTRIIAASPFVFVAHNGLFRITAYDPAEPHGPSDADVLMAEPGAAMAMLESRAARPGGRR